MEELSQQGRVVMCQCYTLTENFYVNWPISVSESFHLHPFNKYLLNNYVLSTKSVTIMNIQGLYSYCLKKQMIVIH